MTAIPPELRERPHWLVWRLEKRDDKWTKVPYRASDPSSPASSTDPATWAPYEEALRAADWGGIDGIGYVFGPDDPFCGIDLDGCARKSEEIHPNALALLGNVDSYCEWSQSGSGIHAIVKAEVERGRKTYDVPWRDWLGEKAGAIEVYSQARYFVMTGRPVRGMPTTIEPRQDVVDRILAKITKPPAETAPVAPAPPVEESDEELLERARAARNGSDFDALYRGDWKGRYPSHSEADLALAGALAFWTGGDPARIDSLFRRSGLMRPKWDRADYRDSTVAQALAGRTDFYEPSSRASVSVPEPVGEPEPPEEDSEPASPRFRRLTHAEALLADVPSTSELVRGLIEAGTLATIVGVPETHKSFLAIQIAARVAAGGSVLGRDVLRSGPVGYFWGDDSIANELRRVQAYSKRQTIPAETPISWYLNQDVRLPEDVDHLVGEVEELGLTLVVVDSFYNTVQAGGLKEEEVAGVFDVLKREVCDKTGATVLLVDHAAWPSEGNRGQARAYGSVFKGAAVRSTIHIERLGDDRLRVQCHANNLIGLSKSIATFDEDELELVLVPETEHVSVEAVAEAVEAFVLSNPHATKRAIREGVEHGNSKIDAAIKQLADEGRIRNTRNGRNGGTGGSRNGGKGRPGDAWVHTSILAEADSETHPLFDDDPTEAGDERA